MHTFVDFIQSNLALSVFIATLIGAIVTQVCIWRFERRATRVTVAPITDESFKARTSRAPVGHLHLVPFAPVGLDDCPGWHNAGCTNHCKQYSECAERAAS